MEKEIKNETIRISTKLSKKGLIELISILGLLGYNEEERLCEKIYFDRFLQPNFVRLQND